MATNAAIYRRISRDPEGLREGVTRQDEDTRALARRLNVTVDDRHVYEDNDTGASTLSRKPRPQYAAMLEAARAGEFGVILAYSNSRLTRRPRELEDLLDLYETNGVVIHTVVSGSDDLSTADGRMVARIKASVDAAEAERMGERLQRAFLQKAQRGDVNNGGRPFGWQADKITLDPVESALLREAVADVIDGVGLRDITRRWNDAGVTTARGNEWDHRALRQLLKQPRLAGWRVHRGEVARDASGAPVRGVWQPLLDEDTYERLQSVMSARPSGSGGRRGAHKYLLSGLARCGTCGARMFGSAVPAGHAYACGGTTGRANRHTLSIAGVMTDEAVSAVVQSRLALAGEFTAPAVTEWGKADRLGSIPAKITEIMSAYNEGTLSAAVAFPQVSALEQEQAELTAEYEDWRAAAVDPGPSNVDPEAFDELDLARKRAVCQRLLDAVVIAPSRKGARWDAERITYVWRTS